MSWLLPTCLALCSAFAVLLPVCRPVGGELLMAVAAFIVWALMAFRAPSSFSLTRFSPMGVYLASYTAMIVLPSLRVRLDMPEVGGEWFFPGVIGVLPLSLLGWWTAMRGFGIPADYFERYYRRPTHIEPGPLPVVAWGLLLGLCVVLAGLHVSLSPVNPLKALLSGASSMELTLAREASFKTLPLPGMKYLLSWLMSVLFPITVLWAAGRAILIGNWTWRIVAVLSVAIALTYATFTIAKAPAAMLVAMLFILAFVVRSKRIPVLAMLGGGLLILLIPGLLVAAISDAGPVAVVFGIARRLFLVPAEALVFYFEAFDVEHPFLHGRSINLVSRTFFSEAPFPIANYIYHIIHPDGIETGLSNAAFIGTMWANYSHLGLLFGPVFVGGFIAGSEIVFTSGEKTLLKVCLHAMICLQVFFLTSRSITVAMLTGGWVPAIALVLIAGFLFKALPRYWQGYRAAQTGV
jgi:hypothetical protein